MYNQGYSSQNQPQQYSGQPQQYPQGGGVWYQPMPTAQPQQRAPRVKPQRGGGNGNGGAGGYDDGSRRPKKRKSLKWQLIKLLLVLIVLGGLAAGGYVWKIQSDVKPYLSVFLDNISVDGINLSGMTWAEGSNAVWAQANAKQSSWYVRLKNASGESKDITAETLGIKFDPSAALEQAWAIGHTPDASNRMNIFTLKDEVQRMQSNSAEFFSAEQTANTGPIDEILSTLERAAHIEPKNAVILSFNPEDDVNPFTFQKEVIGQYLDTTKVKQEILHMVQTFQSGEVMLTPEPLYPDKTVAELQKQVSLRFRAVTPIASSSTEGRNNNIRVANEKINGLVLENGAKFSFNKIVGRRTQKNGFYEAIEYAYGQEVMGWGGGVCQVSTTMYLAAIQAGMTITDRSQHSNPVSYTELGMDATVSDTKGREIDFVFRNNTGGPIFISAHLIPSSTNKKRLQCEIRIYGISMENVRYELESKTVETIPKPAEPTLKEDVNGEYVFYTDERKQVSKGREGHKVETYLCTIVDGVQTERKLVSQDTYPARADVYYVGTTVR